MQDVRRVNTDRYGEGRISGSALSTTWRHGANWFREADARARLANDSQSSSCSLIQPRRQ
eukprot:3815109-Prymnesium_polylepis.2